MKRAMLGWFVSATTRQGCDEAVFDHFRLSDQLRSSADPINDFDVIHVVDPEI
ncbi:hypothetical protein MTR_7g100520 [Medicago truncatula]|uniref:Uncharacterized protein n=1 Tax=Medicago truncatula TaxID=3880 RepID=G7L1N9_MEDTR|nr:hypothetical protein MTR_7g100520 [Medicago truncatula]